MQTNGVLLNKERIKELEKAGLSQINLSIQTLDEKLAKKLSGNENYNLEKILEVAELVAESKIELMIAPVWLPGINDKDIVELIQIAKDLDSKIGIQNYLEYPSSRKIKKIQKLSWFKFYKQLEKWEKEFKIKLKYGPKDFNISKTIRIPVEFKIGERVQAEVISQGWNKDQVIVTAKNRSITVNKCNKKIGDLIKIQVTDNKNSIYLAKPI
jgi:uncharacterized Fe-S cluster-containing radical SAM superfamily enzyme